MANDYILQRMEQIFAALADKTRLRLLNLIREEEVCVCFFTEVLGDNQPKISRHLAYLRNAGLVSSRRDGKWVHYRIEMPDEPALARILSETLEALREEDAMQTDYENLISVCCASVDVPVTIARAPKPEVLVELNAAVESEHLEHSEDLLETFLL